MTCPKIKYLLSNFFRGDSQWSTYFDQMVFYYSRVPTRQRIRLLQHELSLKKDATILVVRFPYVNKQHRDHVLEELKNGVAVMGWLPQEIWIYT